MTKEERDKTIDDYMHYEYWALRNFLVIESYPFYRFIDRLKSIQNDSDRTEMIWKGNKLFDVTRRLITDYVENPDTLPPFDPLIHCPLINFVTSAIPATYITEDGMFINIRHDTAMEEVADALNGIRKFWQQPIWPERRQRYRRDRGQSADSIRIYLNIEESLIDLYRENKKQVLVDEAINRLIDQRHPDLPEDESGDKAYQKKFNNYELAHKRVRERYKLPTLHDYTELTKEINLDPA